MTLHPQSFSKCAGKIGASLQMLGSSSGPTRASANLHRGMKKIADAVGILLVDGFHYLALFAIGAMTVWSAFADFLDMLVKGRAELVDIILFFI